MKGVKCQAIGCGLDADGILIAEIGLRNREADWRLVDPIGDVLYVCEECRPKYETWVTKKGEVRIIPFTWELISDPEKFI